RFEASCSNAQHRRSRAPPRAEARRRSSNLRTRQSGPGDNLPNAPELGEPKRDFGGFFVAVFRAIAPARTADFGCAPAGGSAPEKSSRPVRLPTHARHVMLVQIAIAHYFLREYGASVASSEEAIRFFPEHPWSYRW